jgi:hypothetical protein
MTGAGVRGLYVGGSQYMYDRVLFLDSLVVTRFSRGGNIALELQPALGAAVTIAPEAAKSAESVAKCMVVDYWKKLGWIDNGDKVH